MLFEKLIDLVIFISNFVRIAGEYHINTMDGGSVPMHVMQLAGQIDHGANCSILQSGPMIQGEREIGPSSPVINAARRINHIRHVAGNMSLDFDAKYQCDNSLKR